MFPQALEFLLGFWFVGFGDVLLGWVGVFLVGLSFFFPSLPGFDLCSVALLAELLWVSQVSTQLCSQSKRGFSWADGKSRSCQQSLNQCLILTLLHTEIYVSLRTAQGLLLSSAQELIPAPAYCRHHGFSTAKVVGLWFEKFKAALHRIT